jgi:hypothetical protein
MDEALLTKLSALYIQAPTKECDFESVMIEAGSKSEPELSS